MKPNDLDRLIEHCLEEQLDQAEAARLSTLLEESAEARDRYWELALVHGMLEQGLQTALVKVATGEEAATVRAKPGTIFHWPRLVAAAAGILIGIFSASVVWAYRTNLDKRPLPETTELLFESFEDPSASYQRRFPRDAGLWHGDLSVVNAEEGIEPKRGTYVAKVSPIPGRKFSYARRILDLSELPEAAEGMRREIQVQASFLSSSAERPSQYQIRLGVFREEPKAVRPIWNDEGILFDRILRHVGENHTTNPEDEGWHKMRASVDIPSHARSVVISLAAADSGQNSRQTDHYLDAIRIRLIETPVLPE